jgi:hypothetical protein
MTRIETNTENTLNRELQTRLGNVSESNQRYGGVIISYSGTLDTTSGDSILQLAEKSILYTGGSLSEMKKVCKILTECFQNVSKHGWIDELGETFLHLTIEHNPFGYQIHCRNIVDLEMASTLKLKLNEVNGLNLSQLRKRYVDTLCEGESHHSQGIGLDLLSMAQKSTGPLEYELIKQDNNDLLLFYLTVTVKR